MEICSKSCNFSFTSSTSLPMISGNSINSTLDRKSTRLNSSHVASSYAVFFLKKKTMQGRTLPYMKLQKCEITDIFPTSRICATLGGSLSFRLGSELPHGGCAGKRTTDRSMLY